MRQLQQAASVAAFLIVAGLLIHNLNALYFEPYTLGFENKATDYGDMAKIENALWSFSFTSSGIAHIVVGCSLMIVGLFLSEYFRTRLPISAKLLLLSAVLSGLGFLLTGISDMTTIFRGMVNILAIAALGAFAGLVAWCAGRTGTFPKGLRVFAWINVLPGIMSLVFPPAGFAYIQLLLLWMLWLGWRIRTLPVAH